MDVKMNTDNENNSDDTQSRRRTVDTDEVSLKDIFLKLLLSNFLLSQQDSRSQQKRQNDDGSQNSNSKKDDTANGESF